MKYKTFYILSLLVVVLASVYPIYMGVTALGGSFRNGFIVAADYPKYIIPYTPISIALILSIALLPLFQKLFRRITLLAVSLFGTGVFLVSELWFEQIKVAQISVEMSLEAWQLSLCVVTPEVVRTLGNPLYAESNPAFKIHFYIIAIVILLAVLNVIVGFSNMLREQDFRKKRPLIAQTVSAAGFIGLCILACFTAFYRTGTLNIPPISAVLMTLFFIVFGMTTGIYCGCVFYGKGRLFSRVLPAITASLTTFIMYIGELVLTDGILFKYGSGFFFQPIGALPFAVCDIVIILLSGGFTYSVMQLLNTEGKAV